MVLRHPESLTSRCWRCDRAIDATDRYCRACGEGQGAALAWYYRPLWIVLLALTALGPFAVVLIMRTPRLSPGAKWLASAVLLGFFAWVGWHLWVDTKAILDSI
jgi:hypothetical protein